jgi:four helix bundle protein
MTFAGLKTKTKFFALGVIKLVAVIPHGRANDIIARQILRSATCVGANYRSACRAQSRADFAAKMAIVGEEADETLYWLELLGESGLMKAERLKDLIKEADELVAIVTASRKTAKRVS